MRTIANHRTDGEIGSVFNHHVTEAIGNVSKSLHNHKMVDAAPTTKCIVNHDLSDCTDENELARVLGVYRYPGRVLATTNPGDIVQFHPDLKSGWDWITCHYKNCGIAHATEVIWDDDMAIMSQFPEFEPSVFFFGESAHASRPDEKWYRVVREMNCKNRFLRFAKEMGAPVPRTLFFSKKSDFNGVYDDIDFPVFLKVSRSVSGMGVIRCLDKTELEAQIAEIDKDVSFQIQEDLGDAIFINTQYRVVSGKLERLVITDQVLKGCQHDGNKFPSKFDVWDVTDPLAAKMHTRGMKGYFAFDVAICGFNGSTKAYVIECNPRYNGSSYPTNIAIKLGVGEWSAKNISTGNIKTFNDIDLGDIEYDPTTKVGVVVFNWGCIVDGKIGVFFAGNEKQQKQLEERLRKLF